MELGDDSMVPSTVPCYVCHNYGFTKKDLYTKSTKSNSGNEIRTNAEGSVDDKTSRPVSVYVCNTCGFIIMMEE